MRTLNRLCPGADDGIRTRDPHLGKVVLYQLSHVRACSSILGARSETFNRSHRAPSREIQSVPVEPNPPSPRPVRGRSSAHIGETAGIATITNCAIRSPVWISTA